MDCLSIREYIRIYIYHIILTSVSGLVNIFIQSNYDNQREVSRVFVVMGYNVRFRMYITGTCLFHGTGRNTDGTFRPVPYSYFTERGVSHARCVAGNTNQLCQIWRAWSPRKTVFLQ